MDTHQAVALLLRAANEVQSADTRKDLLTWAGELVTGLTPQTHRGVPKTEEVAGSVEFPLPVTTNVEGRPMAGLLHDDGTLEIDSNLFANPSEAASGLLGYRTNGYRVWKWKDQAGHAWTLEALVHKGLVRKGGLRQKRKRQG